MIWGIDGGHMVELFIAGITFWGITWGFHREDNRRNREMAADREKRQDERHQENQKALAQINTTLEWNPPHAHGEDDDPNAPSTPLMSGKIRYGPRRRH